MSKSSLWLGENTKLKKKAPKLKFEFEKRVRKKGKTNELKISSAWGILKIKNSY